MAVQCPGNTPGNQCVHYEQLALQIDRPRKPDQPLVVDNILKEKKGQKFRCHDGSRCTQKQPETAALKQKHIDMSYLSYSSPVKRL